MIAKAVADNSDDKIKYKVCGVEEYIYPENTYDLVVSNLVLHYIENLAKAFFAALWMMMSASCSSRNFFE